MNSSVCNCKRCVQQLSGLRNLKKHFETEHEARNKNRHTIMRFQVLVQCETCENEFVTLMNLVKHLRWEHELETQVFANVKNVSTSFQATTFFICKFLNVENVHSKLIPIRSWTHTSSACMKHFVFHTGRSCFLIIILSDM